MAAKAPLASLYAEDAEEQLLVDEIKNTYANLRSALENRRQLFDPVLLAAAQGFLAPTKSGSFGESIGNVAALVGPAQEAENKRQMDMAKMRLELAQGELGMRQAARGEEEFRRLVGGRPPAAGGGDEFVQTPGGLNVLRSEVEGSGKTTAGTVLPETRPQTSNAPAGFTNITPADIARLASRPGMEGRAKILADMVKMDQDRYAIAMNGTVFDKRDQKYLDLPIPGQKQEDFETPYGTFRMLPYEYSQFMNAVKEGRGEEWMRNWRGGQPGAPGRRTVEEIGAAAKGAETTAVKGAESEVARTQEAIARSDSATETLATIRSVRSIASRPDAKEIFGIFQTGDFSSFVGNLISERLKVPGASNTFEAGDLVGAFRNLGLTDDQIARYQFALARLATIQLQQAKLAAGQGSVSNFERNLFADASISPKDTPTTIVAKLAVLEARSNFDKEVARELRRTKMSLDQYKDKNEEKYQKMVDSYLDKISGIAMNIGARPRPGQPRPGTPGQFGPSRDKLKDELGI
jgi:hypothetical protein